MSKLPGNHNEASNRIPLQHEIAKLHALALEKQERLDDITASARRLRVATSEIRHRYQEQSLILKCLRIELKMSEEATGSLDKAASLLEKDLDTLKGLLHPIRRAPDDILRLIFEHAVQNEIEMAEDKRQWVAVWLSHVCSRWRSVAVSTPRIWSHMNFTIRASGPFSNEPLKAFLSRAKSVPISLTLEFQFGNHSAAGLVRAYQLLGASTVQFSHFSTLEIHIDTASSYSYLDRFPPFIFTTIDSLILSVSAHPQEGVGMTHLISNFKRVRELFIKWTYFGPLDLPIKDSIPSGLERLEVVCVDGFPLLELLAQLPNLRYFVASGCTVTEPTTSTFNDSVLTSLEMLNIYCTLFPWASTKCPRLKSLTIDMNYLGDQQVEDFLRFLERTQSISSVHLEGGSESYLSQLAHKAPQITRLQIDDGMEGTVIQDIFVDESAFPNLHHLALHSHILPIAGLDAAIRIRRIRNMHLQEAGDGADFDPLEEIVFITTPEYLCQMSESDREYLESFLYLCEEVQDSSILTYRVIDDEKIGEIEM
ncbi:hypothetical protein M408DRAFT_29195 [Serendipita vermifera MAFF 305830]|uniref:Uncharacterized protein n=1 Tax=Serendipita vermifera MAFF 305830 TaxID=933852 RepID=A0A0C3ARH0_SERVB|nr:hypothetical protein M408DRAFT_29195 [Serendipita vermifera MAFF 305830]